MPSRKIPDYAEMKRLYDDGLSTTEIAEKFGVKPATVISAMRRLGIPRRTPKETITLQRKRGIIRKSPSYWKGKKQPREMVEKRISKIRGEKHYLWKGGYSLRPYRNVVSKKACNRCPATENLGIHHINLDHYDNHPKNLEILCVSCHSSVHKQAYWDSVHAGEEPKKSNAPIGWRR